MTERRVDPDACVLCGACRAVCPIFMETLRECDVARGRVARVKYTGQQERFTAADREAFSLCLMCGRCLEVCKADLDIPHLMQRARAESGYAAGIPRLVAETLAKHPSRLSTVARLAATWHKWLARLPEDSGLRRRLGDSYLSAGRLLPSPPADPYLARQLGRRAQGDRKLALFAGCGAGWLLSEIGDAIDAILAALDLVAAVPAQNCCGLPAWGLGADDAADAGFAAWREAFSGNGYEAVLTPCASCAAHLQEHLGEGAETPLEEFFVWLARQELAVDLSGVKLAVHVPCHTRRGVRGGDAVTPMLREAGAEIVELPTALDEQCCGMGGTFGAQHTDLSRRIGLPKVDAMLEAEPAAIVSHCTGCLLQLRDLVRYRGSSVPVAHPVQWLAKGLTGRT
ncbi:MAG: (Fe-S)-binding protein [Candidatus Lernaella stagnicola]|nr:(Fe-S)-binding protein [Candidatus Lernaella stagnicola]